MELKRRAPKPRHHLFTPEVKEAIAALPLDEWAVIAERHPSTSAATSYAHDHPELQVRTEKDTEGTYTIYVRRRP